MVLKNKAGILFKHAGWVSPNKICSSLINHKNIKFIPKKKAKEISYKNNLWVTSCDDSKKYAASNLILCNSFALNEISLFKGIDLKKIEVKLTGFQAKKNIAARKLFRIAAISYLMLMDLMFLARHMIETMKIKIYQ